MDPCSLTQIDPTSWRIEPSSAMRVPAIIYADEDLVRGMDDKVAEQAKNVASLPGIIGASYVMPDAHWGYGFPIGGVAAFDPAEGGVVSAGGVGFDISCGVRTMVTDLSVADVKPLQAQLADALFHEIPAGVGSKSAISLDPSEMNAMLSGGARWAVERGLGDRRDPERIEEGGSWPAQSRQWSRTGPRKGSAARWARLALAIIISRFRLLPKSSILLSPQPSASPWTRSFSLSIVDHAGSAIRSEPSLSKKWR
jgi:hypothetical protein